MTENDIKSSFKSLKKLKAKKEVLKCIEKADHEYNQLCRIIHIAENSLDSLSESERDIIQMHLIDGYTWEQIMNQHERYHGQQNVQSKRTYERIQQKALKQILGIIDSGELDAILTNFVEI